MAYPNPFNASAPDCGAVSCPVNSHCEVDAALCSPRCLCDDGYKDLNDSMSCEGEGRAKGTMCNYGYVICNPRCGRVLFLHTQLQ